MENADKISWIAQIFQNPIADAIIFVGLIALVIILAVLGNKGLLKINVKGVTLGNDETERMIVRQQVEYAKAAVDTFVESIGYSVDNRYRARYISELALDIIIESICYNHIVKDSFYIDGKVDKIWAIIMKYAASDEYKTDEFKNKVSTEVRKCFEHLVDLRKYYKENK